MPARPAVPHVVKCEVLWTQGGVPAANILHVGYSGDAPGSSALIALATAVSGALQTYLGLILPASCTCTEVLCTDLASNSGNVGAFSTPWNGSSESSAVISAGSSIMTNWQIARRYRGGKPRTYWPAPSQNALVSQSQFGAGAVDLLNTAMTHLFTVAGDTHGGLVCTGLKNVSYFEDKTTRVDPLVDDITGFANGTLLRTQRRRITASSF